MNINTLFSGKNTARQRLGTKDWDSTCGILHILPSLTLIHLRLVSRYFQHHEPESSTVDFYHPWIWFPIARWHFQDPIYVWWLPIIYGFSEWFKGRFTGTAKKWWGTPWFPIDFPWISRHWWPFCAPQTTSSGRFTQLPLAPHGADQRCLTPVVSTILSHVMLVAFADSIHS